LRSIVSFAFVLGFVYEEEFVILALAASQSIDPIILILAYAVSVAVALVGVTVISLKFYQHFQYRMIHYSKYLPKISALFLIFMSIIFFIGII
jgi:nickel/cobalt transporter (NicO) family protein